VFYEDLSAYDYLDDDAFTDPQSGFHALWYRPAYTRLTVGWLAAGRPYPTGPVPPAFVEKLTAVQEVHRMNECLGFHACDLCPADMAPEGNGEVRIPGAPGIAYAAPVLIAHYVTAHGYRPPQAFVDAVLAVDLVPQRLTLALLKPGAPREPIRTRLRTVLREVHTVERHLTAEDCDRLYPDAYGAEFVAPRTAYLTGGPVQVIVLAGDVDAVAVGSALKRTLRADLGTETLRNHVHMPDNPGEALADIALLAGWDVLDQLYRRWEIHHGERHVAARLAGYRAHLGRGAGAVGMVGPRRPPGEDEPAARGC
jgi:nucleoside diphosphate kinase